MRPRTEVAIAFGAFSLLALIALEAGRRRRGFVDTDRRASSYLTGPRGLAGMAQVVERMGGRVERWRGRAQVLRAEAVEQATLVVADPVANVSADDVHTILAWSEAGGDLVLGGEGAGAVMRCVGYSTSVQVFDSSRVVGPSGVQRGWVQATLRGEGDPLRALTEVPPDADEDPPSCPPVRIVAIDTLLRSDADAPVAIRLTRGDTVPSSILLLSDMSMLNNRGLREAEIPEFLLGGILARSRTVIFDEYHHGFGASGSLGAATLAWSRTNPWGWLIWQAAIAGLLAFVAGAIRFGPVRAGIPRERRSPLEHVKALATALAAARGHDVAIASLVRGLRRRLQARTGAERAVTMKEPWPAWAERLRHGARNNELRERASTLTRYAVPGQPDSAVRDAANAVEDVWEALHR